MPTHGDCTDALLEELRGDGVDDEELAARLQIEGVEAFAQSWQTLMTCLRDKQIALAPATRLERKKSDPLPSHGGHDSTSDRVQAM